jgi:hypothetical protein
VADTRETTSLLEKVAVGATFATVTALVYSLKPSSVSMIRVRTVCLVGPSSKAQLTEQAVPLDA